MKKNIQIIFIVLLGLVLINISIGRVNAGKVSNNQVKQKDNRAIFQDNNPLIDELTKDTWNYLGSDWATSNHLPWSWRSDSVSGGDYVNTAEIGFYALSWIAAYDMEETWSPNWNTTEAEVIAILDQLRAWQTGSQASQPHGANAYASSVFYQWYWISWDPPVVGDASGLNHLVPSIDNAWLAASLITIREYADANDHATLAQKADDILMDMDFSPWYHTDTHRFNWGGVEDPKGGTQADYYSNENRIINFIARALGDLDAAEYALSLAALSQPTDSYDGITVDKIAYDGSYFTYAGPALFIREMQTSYGEKTLNAFTQAQIRYAENNSYDAWGLSDCYDIEDGDYIQQGSLPAGLGSPETHAGLISPHASVLALITDQDAIAIENLQYLVDTYSCVYDDNYGFKDSVLAYQSSADNGKCSYRFSALNQEWIFLSLVNYNNGFIWDYFYRDEGVQAAHAEMYPPDNDDISSAKTITSLSFSHDILTLGATTDVDDPDIDACNIIGKGQITLWYEYTPNVNTAISIDTSDADYDTFIAVWTKEGGKFVPVACNNNGAEQAALALQAEQDVTYYIEIGQP